MKSLKERLLELTPPAYRQRLVDIKNALWGGYRHYYYSQFGEDIVVTSLLRSPKGLYVDIGANHPKRYSNTQLLHERGWHGINVDPNEEAMGLFARARPRDINLTCGVARSEGTLQYHRFSDPAYNTFSKEAAEGLHKKRWLTELPASAVPVVRLDTLLDTHVPAETRIDFLNVDVEGMDLEVLESNNWEKYRPTVIAVEDTEFVVEHPHQSAVYTYLAERGYRLQATLGCTIIFSTNAR